MAAKKEREETIEEQVKHVLLAKSEISLNLDSYDDIFSDFDPRPYSQRGLSEDFLSEARHAAVDKGDNSVELRFLIPAKARNTEQEETIRKRLQDHFKKHLILVEKDVMATKRKGILMTLAGVVMLVLAGLIIAFKNHILSYHLLLVLLEPGGWFTAWTGMDQLFYTVREKQPELDFYRKMSQADIIFSPY